MDDQVSGDGDLVDIFGQQLDTTILPSPFYSRFYEMWRTTDYVDDDDELDKEHSMKKVGGPA